MRVLVYVCCLLAAVCNTLATSHDWDMAVAVGDKIEFLDQNVSVIGITHQVFHNLKALAYDTTKRQFIISDMDDRNMDSIYKIRVSNTKNPIPIFENITDDVVDVAVDPIDEVLYWVDSSNKRIMKKSLNDSEAKSEILFQFFKDDTPQGIAIDSCRRSIYWSMANEFEHSHSIVEKANLDGTGRKTVVEGNLENPSGIVVDHMSRRIYWTDMGSSQYFKIESAKLDGSDRQIVYENTHQKPFRIAVSEEYIYWIDTSTDNYAIWGIKKDETGLKPEKLRRFNEKPKGLVTKNNDYTSVPECENLLAQRDTTTSSGEDIVPVIPSDYCLNFGELTPYGCKCSRGYTGPRCDISLCHNLCMNGICYVSSQGYPKCKCPKGFVGERCEIELCKNFCLNEGTCSTRTNGTWPKCTCPEGFTGNRCEKRDEPEVTCTCEEGMVITPIDGGKPFCSCSSTPTPLDYPSAFQQLPSTFTRLQDPLVLAFMFVSLLLLLVTCMLSAAMCKLRHRRPRIKKRIIVNKNVTPLTCRPNPPQEQCEITIENCCNMNICETPCFEPTSLRGFQRNKTEEKKTLLTSMENGEDLY